MDVFSSSRCFLLSFWRIHHKLVPSSDNTPVNEDVYEKEQFPLNTISTDIGAKLRPLLLKLDRQPRPLK